MAAPVSNDIEQSLAVDQFAGLRAADGIVRVDVGVGNGPAFRLRKSAGILDLSGDTFRVGVRADLLGTFAGVNGSKHLRSLST